MSERFIYRMGGGGGGGGILEMEMEVVEERGEEGMYCFESDNKPSSETKCRLINKTAGAIVKDSLLSVIGLHHISLFVSHGKFVVT